MTSAKNDLLQNDEKQEDEGRASQCCRRHYSGRIDLTFQTAHLASGGAYCIKRP